MYDPINVTISNDIWEFLIIFPVPNAMRIKYRINSSFNIIFSSAVEVPSYFIGWYFMDKWGRRWILFSTMMIGGLSCISCMFVPVDADPWWTVGLAMIGKFNIALSFAVIYVYAGELMPTVVRSQVSITVCQWQMLSWNNVFSLKAMGISSFVAGIGLLVFPYINSLVSDHGQLVIDW